MRHLTPIFFLFIALISGVNGVSQSKSNLDVVIYTIPGCLGCNMAKSMFEERGIPYQEINVQRNKPRYNEMVLRAGGQPGDLMSVPQIFINGKHIGGYRDLSALDLDTMIAGKKATPEVEPLSSKTDE